MINQNILVSVLVTTYNHEAYIAQCIESIVSQKVNFNFEILVGLDIGVDETENICYSKEKEHATLLKVFSNDPSNVLYINGRRLGRLNFLNIYKSAKGKYIARCDGDDFWTDPYKLQKQFDFMEENKGFSLCFHNANVIDEIGNVIDEKMLSDNKIKEYSESELKEGTYIPSLSLFFRNSIKEFPKQYFKTSTGDVFLISILGYYGKGKCLNFIGGSYRKHIKGIWSSIDKFQQTIELINDYDHLARFHNEKEDKEISHYYKVKRKKKLSDLPLIAWEDKSLIKMIKAVFLNIGNNMTYFTLTNILFIIKSILKIILKRS